MLSVSNLLIGYGPDGRANYANSMQCHSSIEEYIRVTKMDRDGTWGSGIEVACARLEYIMLLNLPTYYIFFPAIFILFYLLFPFLFFFILIYSFP